MTKRKPNVTAEKIRKALAMMGRIADRSIDVGNPEGRPHTEPHVVHNADGSIDGQMIFRGNWNNIETQAIDLLGPAQIFQEDQKVVLPRGSKIAAQVRFGAGEGSEERTDKQITGYRRVCGLPSISLYYRKPQNVQNLILALMGTGESLLAKGWEVVSIAIDIRIAPPGSEEARRRKGKSKVTPASVNVNGYKLAREDMARRKEMKKKAWAKEKGKKRGK